MDSIIISRFFKIWKNKKTRINRDRTKFEENCQEELDEIEYARVIGNMDSIHWCWNCKYSDCDQH